MTTTLIRSFLHRIVMPRSGNEDTRRREFILNVLVLGSILLLVLATIIDAVHSLSYDPVVYQNDSASLLVIGAVLLLFLALYVLSRSGFVQLASYLLLCCLFLLATYMAYEWGFDVSAAALFYALVIVMAGVLIHTQFAFLTAGAIGVVMGVTGHLQITGALPVNSFWKSDPGSYTDVVMTTVVFLIIATVSWLSNREIERSLARARHSEAALKGERDFLEVRVKERTDELRKAEVENLSQAYRFVEFGRLASGLFHDLMSPLTALSLTMDSIARTQGTGDSRQIALLAEEVASAKRATAHMQRLMDSMRKHLSHESTRETFSIEECLQELSQVLSSYARQRGVTLSLAVSSRARTYGDPVAFAQIVTNLVSNAIESFPSHASRDGRRDVRIEFTETGGQARVAVRDSGAGIPPEVLDRIFDPFFTTKGPGEGLGIGLPLAKRVIEKEFGGTLSVESALGGGSVFTIYFPVREP